MPRLYRGNFSFEEELSGYRQKLPIQRLEAELACCWLPVADAGDFIWCPQPVGHGFFARMSASGLPAVRPVSDRHDVPANVEVISWGWSEPARSFAADCGGRFDAPAVDAVRRANSRRFNLKCEIDWGVVPPDVAAVESLPKLEEILKRTVSGNQRWVLKSEFSHAARERMLGRGPELTLKQAQWAAKRLTGAGVLFFEPWFDRRAEVGIQWTVPRSGLPRLLGITSLLTDGLGQYLGSRFGVDGHATGDWQKAVECSERAVQELQRIGYFGPVGIDALRYVNEEGEELIRPLQDINARWTMGRLSLGWQHLFPEGTSRHGTRQQRDLALTAQPGRCLSTSPDVVGDQVVEHATWLEFNV